MKKGIRKAFTFLLCAIAIFASGCGKTGGEETHVCQFDVKSAEERFLKSAATCQSGAIYYCSCSCGKAGEKTFVQGVNINHDYSAEVVDSKYLKKAQSCVNERAEYYSSCTMCGKKGGTSTTFFVDVGYGDHHYEETVALEYLKSEATLEESEIYYKSCVACGGKSDETFHYGEKLRTYTDEEKALYKPTSLTVTLYDTSTSTYGFTYNTEKEPLRPVLQIAEGDSLEQYEEYHATVSAVASYDDEKEIAYYVVKAEVALQPSTVYTYRVYDKYVDVGTEITTLHTKDTTATSFKFAHFSDSQVSTGSGVYLANVLSKTVSENDFILHTGDIVDDASDESQWTGMLDTNYGYLSQIPLMTISGNHETTHVKGVNELFKHFHNKLPVQSSTANGYFYSFVYGNAKFIMLNTNDLAAGNKLKAEQYDWLVNELKDNTCTWTFVAMHNPMYAVGKYGANPEYNQVALALRAQLQGIFAEYGVDVVLQGHDHAISRTYPIDKEGNPLTETWETENGINYSVDPNGTVYVMNGPAGDQVRGVVKNDETLYKYAQGSYVSSWAEFEISGNTLQMTVKYYLDGDAVVVQTWGIKKTAA